MDGGEVDTGQLNLANVSAGVWCDASAASPGTVIPDITQFSSRPATP